MEPPDKCLVNCDLFGRHAEYFESRIVPYWQVVYDSLVSRAGIAKGESVLDAGTGTGEVALRASPAVGPSGRVVGIDLEEAMLAIARRKAQSRRLGNLDFRVMSMEKMAFPDSSFDSVLGNYSLCCCFDYEAALGECFRVLKKGGRLTYNHSGLEDPVASETIYELFEGYKPMKPSKRLKAVRASDEAQMKAFEKYRDPELALATMRKAGYRGVDASVVPRKIRYPTAATYVDRMIEFDWRSEVEEMDAEKVRKLRKKAIDALAPLSKGPGFVVEDETVYFTGLKA